MIETSGVSPASPDAVWRVVSDPERWPELLTTFDSVRRLDGPSPTAVGSRFEVRQPGLRASTYEVTEWTPGELFIWVARSPGVVTTATHRIVPDGQGSRLVQSIDFAGPLGWLVGFLAAGKVRSMLDLETSTLLDTAAGS